MILEYIDKLRMPYREKNSLAPVQTKIENKQVPKRHNYFYFYTQVMFKLHQPYVLVLFLTFFLLLAVSWGKVGCWPDSKLFSPFFEVTNHQQRWCVPKCLLGMFYLRSRPCHPIFVKLSNLTITHQSKSNVGITVYKCWYHKNRKRDEKFELVLEKLFIWLRLILSREGQL